MEKKNTILLAVIAIATLLVAVVGATFAYFASEIKNNGNLNVNVAASGKKASFVSTSSGDVNFTVDAFEMQQSDVGDGTNQSTNLEYAKGLTDNATLNITLLASDEGKETTCTYDIIYTWTAGDNNFTGEGYESLNETGSKNKYYPSKYYVRTGYKTDDSSDNEGIEGFKEFTVEGDLTVGVETLEEERPGTYEGIKETNIDEFKPKDGTDNNKILILSSGNTITSTSTTNKSYHNYTFTFRFYNLNKDQSSLMGKTFAGTISVDNVHC